MLRMLVLSVAVLLSLVGQTQVALQAPPKNTLAPQPLPALAHPTLDRIHADKALVCGVVKEEEDYSRSEDHGNRAAFDIDLCKAVAVAALGPGARLVIKTFPDEPFALRALKAGQVDLLGTASLSVSNMTADVALSAPILLDGQTMLLAKSERVQSPLDLQGKRVCFLTGSAAEDGLHSYADTHRIRYVWYPFSEAGEMEAAFFTGNCDAVTGDRTQLANIRGIDAGRAAEFTILPQTMRPDPLAMATWAGDPAFSALVYWTGQVLLSAEQLGVSREALPSLRTSERPEILQLLGQGPGVAATLQARPHWGAEVIEAVGNYGELYDRDLGPHSAMNLDRNENRLTQDGGQLLPLPVRDR